MQIAIKCKKCGHTEGKLMKRDTHIGLYCNECGSWQKWVSKEEYEMLMSQENTVNEAKEFLVDAKIDIKELEKQRDELNSKISQYYEAEIQKAIKDNAGFIGKTYKRLINSELTGYYKIIGIDKNNQYRMNTLVFALPVIPFRGGPYSYEEEAIMTIESIGWFCNELSTYGLPVREIDTYTEIPNLEYVLAFNEWEKKVRSIVEQV